MSLSDRLFGSPRDRFAAAVLAALRARGQSGVYVADDFRVDVSLGPGESPVRIYLANTFAESEGLSTTERDENIARLVATADRSSVPSTWAEVKALLRPVLRPASFGSGLGEQTGREPIARPAMPLLSELVVMDLPATMQYVGWGRLGEWGVSADEVFAAARENLAGAADPSRMDASPGPKMIRFVETGDAYFSSMPLIPGWLAAMRGPAGGRPVAFVTEHSGLLVVGTDPEKGIAAILDMAFDEYREAVRPISPTPYTVDDAGNVVEYDVPPGHPDWPALRRARSALIASVYGRQGEALRAEYERDAVDVFVASVIQASGRRDGSPFTVAAWTDGIQSSLPRTHYVAIGDPLAMVPFEAVVDILGLRPTEGLYPERYRVGGWPDVETMARLRAVAEEP